MFLDFRSREYRLEEERAGAALPSRTAAHDHPLASASSHSMRSSSERARTEAFQKVDSADYQNVAVNDPLRVHVDQIDESVQRSVKEWAVFTKGLSQKFSHSSMANVTVASDILPGILKENERSSMSMHLDGMDDPEKALEDEKKIATKHEYISRLKELKIEICRAWKNEDRNTALKLAIKVAKFLSDTSLFQFYPVLFVLVTEIMDLLGDLVWDRIKRKAEWTDDGNFICALQDDFVPGDVSFDAKELCYNWFAKIGSIHELLPRIYLELAILRCWRFLEENPSSYLGRLTMMMRGLADPVTSAYCHLYMVHCVQSLDPGDVGYLVISINDISISLRRIIIEKEITGSNLGGNKRLLISLLEPAIEWIMKVMLKAEKHNAQDILIKFGLSKSISQSNEITPCLSVVLHYLLKELPGNIVLINALELLELIKCSSDISFEQHLNFRLLGLKLSENQLSVNHSDITVKKVLQVVSQYDGLAEYLIVLDAYFEIILQKYSDGVVKRAENRSLTGNEMDSLLSILVKVIHNLNGLEDVLALKHFIQIFDLLNGDPRITASRHILGKVTRDVSIHDPRTIQFLFEASRALHDGINFSSSKDGNHTIAGLICRFVQTVDFGDEMEGQLQFLVECRVAFRNINELKVYFIHSSNALATRGIKNVDKFLGFIRACIAFSEVTIPSILDASCCLNLYLETAEVALSAGLISHVDGLVGAAISCLESTNLNIGANAHVDADRILSSLLKLCSTLVMVPCTHGERASRIARTLFSLVDSQSWVTLVVRVKMLCAIIHLLATLSQKELPYRSSNGEVVGNDLLFFEDASYKRDLASTSDLAARDLVERIEREPNAGMLGKLALDACNCLVISFEASEGLLSMCSRMMKVARSCLHPQDKYLQSTITFLNCRLPGLTPPRP